MTKEEIDALIKILLDLKKKGQFRAFWTTFNDSVNLMASGEVVIESMWSPAVALLVAQGQNVRYAAPPDGLPRLVRDRRASRPSAAKDPALLQACYDYINWWTLGRARRDHDAPGLLQRRRRSRPAQFVEPEEWDFWIDGKPAAKDLPGITGQVGDIKAGQVRDGGSFVDRACNYSSWNSYFTENEYQVQQLERVPQRLVRRMADETSTTQQEGAAPAAPSAPPRSGSGPRAAST